jgi:hypothetical protein
MFRNCRKKTSDRINIITRWGDLLDGFWIGWLDLLHLIHSHSSGLHAIQRYRYSTHFQFTVAHALGFSVFTSRILATDLSQSHCNFKSHVKSSCHRLIPFLPFLRLPIPRLNSTALDYCSILLCTPSPTVAPALLNTSYNHFVWISRKTPCIVVPLPINRRPIIACSCVADMCLHTRCLAMGIHVTIYIKVF